MNVKNNDNNMYAFQLPLSAHTTCSKYWVTHSTLDEAPSIQTTSNGKGPILVHDVRGTTQSIFVKSSDKELDVYLTAMTSDNGNVLNSNFTTMTIPGSTGFPSWTNMKPVYWKLASTVPASSNPSGNIYYTRAKFVANSQVPSTGMTLSSSTIEGSKGSVSGGIIKFALVQMPGNTPNPIMYAIAGENPQPTGTSITYEYNPASALKANIGNPPTVSNYGNSMTFAVPLTNTTSSHALESLSFNASSSSNKNTSIGNVVINVNSKTGVSFTASLDSTRKMYIISGLSKINVSISGGDSVTVTVLPSNINDVAFTREGAGYIIKIIGYNSVRESGTANASNPTVYDEESPVCEFFTGNPLWSDPNSGSIYSIGKTYNNTCMGYNGKILETCMQGEWGLPSSSSLQIKGIKKLSSAAPQHRVLEGSGVPTENYMPTFEYGMCPSGFVWKSSEGNSLTPLPPNLSTYQLCTPNTFKSIPINSPLSNNMCCNDKYCVPPSRYYDPVQYVCDTSDGQPYPGRYFAPISTYIGGSAEGIVNFPFAFSNNPTKQGTTKPGYGTVIACDENVTSVEECAKIAAAKVGQEHSGFDMENIRCPAGSLSLLAGPPGDLFDADPDNESGDFSGTSQWAACVHEAMCSSDDQCRKGESCSAGFCTCTTSDDCNIGGSSGSSYECVSGYCQPSCNSDGNNYYMNFGTSCRRVPPPNIESLAQNRLESCESIQTLINNTGSTGWDMSCKDFGWYNGNRGALVTWTDNTNQTNVKYGNYYYRHADTLNKVLSDNCSRPFSAGRQLPITMVEKCNAPGGCTDIAKKISIVPLISHSGSEVGYVGNVFVDSSNCK